MKTFFEIAIEIENKCDNKMFDPDPDSDFDPERDISETIKAQVNDIDFQPLFQHIVCKFRQYGILPYSHILKERLFDGR